MSQKVREIVNGVDQTNMGTNLNDFLPMVDKLVSIHKEKVPAYEKVITDLTSQVLILDESKKGAEKHAS